MEAGLFQTLIYILEDSFENLNADISAIAIEDLAVTIHRVMSMETRRFHTLDHALSLTDSNAPLRSLAALFHDLIYYEIECEFPVAVFSIIDPYLGETDSGTLLLEPQQAEDFTFELLRELFALSPGQPISSTIGINEFLSALVAWKKLEHVLSNTLLVQIAVHIEATIPFRGSDEQNENNFDRMADRMKKICQNYHIPISDVEVDETILSAVAFANQDVAGFAKSDPAIFLDNTWKLLPEVNAELRSGMIYSIREYRQALQKMEKFFAWLEPANIFHSYKGYPSERELRQMTSAAKRNIELAREYLCVKLLAISILEALAEISGGDTPLAFFMGDIQAKGVVQQRLENYLPAIPMPESRNINSTVYRLLSDGRTDQTQFDIRNAPLALFFYKCLGSDGCETLLSGAQEMFAGKRTPSDFLAMVDPQVISAIAQACVRMVPTRRELLQNFLSTISP